jgi:Glycosyl hydrolases family 16
MPAGCGVWPAFWLTDEENWPVHGEIDIVEGVNYQSVAKTALHSTKGCSMYDIPIGTMTGGWDTAQGIPNSKTGVPDMTLRYAQNCFVYDPHQWLNQGCVAVDTFGESIGQPLNNKGGGIYALEWDPINRHIRSWVFSPHSSVPENLLEAIRSATLPLEERIMPNPELWPIPYGYFAIGDGTDCPSSHFRQMRLVFNTAFCGSVAGNRFHLDCPEQALNFSTCNDWIQSNPVEMSESYWKIGGVFVYEREWEKRLS